MVAICGGVVWVAICGGFAWFAGIGSAAYAATATAEDKTAPKIAGFNNFIFRFLQPKCL